MHVNITGAKSGLLFAGQSFVQAGNKTILAAQKFKACTLEFELDQVFEYEEIEFIQDNYSLEQMKAARLTENFELSPLSQEDCAEILAALKFGLSEHAQTQGVDNFTLALSGGLDSSVALTITRLAMKEGQHLEAIYMPSIHSSIESYDYSFDLCKKLGVNLTTLPIKFLHSTTKNLFSQSFTDPLKEADDEAIRSRLRIVLLGTRSEQIKSLIVGTSSKSKLAIGNAKEIGEGIGVFNLLGDLYQSEIISLAKYINRLHPGTIPLEIIDGPSKLKSGEKARESLPEPKVVDSILEAILSEQVSREDLIEKNFDEDEVDKVLDFYKKSEFKSYQFCPIIKLTSRSFGSGYRMPIY